MLPRAYTLSCKFQESGRGNQESKRYDEGALHTGGNGSKKNLVALRISSSKEQGRVVLSQRVSLPEDLIKRLP
jgi:hypothetical protein